jgi:hypothetical protein
VGRLAIILAALTGPRQGFGPLRGAGTHQRTGRESSRGGWTGRPGHRTQGEPRACKGDMCLHLCHDVGRAHLQPVWRTMRAHAPSNGSRPRCVALRFAAVPCPPPRRKDTRIDAGRRRSLCAGAHHGARDHGAGSPHTLRRVAILRARSRSLIGIRRVRPGRRPPSTTGCREARLGVMHVGDPHAATGSRSTITGIQSLVVGSLAARAYANGVSVARGPRHRQGPPPASYRALRAVSRGARRHTV